MWFKKGSSPSWQGMQAREAAGHTVSTPGSRERCAAHFSLFIQPGTAGHGRVHCHLGWVFLPQLTNLEAPLQRSPGRVVFQVIMECQFGNQYQPPKSLLRGIRVPRSTGLQSVLWLYRHWESYCLTFSSGNRCEP